LKIRSDHLLETSRWIEGRRNWIRESFKVRFTSKLFESTVQKQRDFKKMRLLIRCQWLSPIILVTQEAEIRRTAV
jgi:hypothetical protein